MNLADGEAGVGGGASVPGWRWGLAVSVSVSVSVSLSLSSSSSLTLLLLFSSEESVSAEEEEGEPDDASSSHDSATGSVFFWLVILGLAVARGVGFDFGFLPEREKFSKEGRFAGSNMYVSMFDAHLSM